MQRPSRRILEPKTDRPVILETTPPGQALTTLEGLTGLSDFDEVLVTSCDHAVALSNPTWQRFQSDAKSHRIDAAIFTIQEYPGADRKPKSYAYVETLASNEPFQTVLSVSVKQPISDPPSKSHLLVGTFWFSSVQLLREAILELKKRGSTVNGELYLDSVFSVLLEWKKRVVVIPLDGYLCWGDPDAYRETEYWRETFAASSEK
jgi:hypothetical protein